MTEVQDVNSTVGKFDKEVVNDRFVHVGQYLRKTFEERLAAHGNKLYHTKTKGLSTAYLENFADPAFRQSVTCVCCQQFIRNFGGLCFITDTGDVVSAIWDGENAAVDYAPAFAALEAEVASRRPVGRFWGPLEPWGRSEVNGWKHFSLPMMEDFATGSPSGKNGGEKNAVKDLNLALNDFSLDDCNRAMHVLSSGVLNNQKKFIPMLQFLIDLHEGIVANPGKRSELVVKAAGYCSDGWATPRKSMIGTLIDWVRESKSGNYITRSWNERVSADVYKRPTVAPSEGNIQQGEKLIEELGLKQSIKRRQATFDEIKPYATWLKVVPEPEAAQESDSAFGHLKAKDKVAPPAAIELPRQDISLNEFMLNVLPKALEVRLSMQPYNRYRFSGFMNAVDQDAPPILTWDTAEVRNRFSAWAITEGLSPIERGLPPTATWHDVTAIMPPIPSWTPHGLTNELGGGIIAIVPGQKPLKDLGQALFPDTITSKLHGIRKTIEAYSVNTPCPNLDEVSALGVLITTGAVFEVKTKTGTLKYHIAYINKD